MLEGKSFVWPLPPFCYLIRSRKTLEQYVTYVATKFQPLPLKSGHTWSQETHLRSMSLGVNSNESWLTTCDLITRDEC